MWGPTDAVYANHFKWVSKVQLISARDAEQQHNAKTALIEHGPV